jgi:hypothetical protein
METQKKALSPKCTVDRGRTDIRSNLVMGMLSRTMRIRYELDILCCRSCTPWNGSAIACQAHIQQSAGALIGDGRA